MSAENFIRIFKEKRKSLEESVDFLEYQTWVSKNNTWFNRSREELEKQGLSKIVGLAVTSSKAENLGVSAQFKELYDRVSKNTGKNDIRADIVDGVPTILFPDVAFTGGIERTLDKYLGTGTYAKAKELNFIKGHVFGFMTGAIQGATEELHNFLTNEGTAARPRIPMMSVEEADHALNFLHILVKHLQRLDIDSAGIKTISHPLLAKYNKSAENFLIELQLEVENAESAKMVQALSGRKGGSTGIRGLINPGSIQQDALNGILDKLRQDGTFSNNEILEFKSSPSLKELLVDKVLTALGNSKKLKTSYSGKTKLPVKAVSTYVNDKAKQEYRNKLKKVIKDARANITKLNVSKGKAALRTTSGRSYSLASLQMLINTHLQNVVSANMGDEGYPGGQRKILNYRTGRLAASASVDRMSISREGMVTAFYSYMRNPYQTFSAGGMQQNPASRDPKLLISTSIKEIAATKVGARLRAVLV